MRARLLPTALMLLVLAGCTEAMLPEARLRTQTEAYLGQPVTAVYNRRSAGFNNTRYEVRTPRGQYSCLVNGGHALDFGIISAITCRPA